MESIVQVMGSSIQYGKMIYPTRPLERVEIDHTILDILVLDDDLQFIYGRPTLTYALCMGMRYPFGVYPSFEPPSYLSVMECLYHAICPKDGFKERYGTQHEWLSYGIPMELVVDRGREFRGSDLRDACETLGIKLTYAPPHTPQFKAGVERAYRSLNTGFLHKLPGTTFSNPRHRGDYDSEKKAGIRMSDFIRALMIYSIDIYPQSYHRGLKGIPARRMQEAIDAGFQPRLPTSARDLGIILGRTETRVIHHYGIEFESIRYNDPGLGPLRDRLKSTPVKIKYHPQDLSSIYVYNESERRYLTIPALDQEYTQQLSLWKHRVLRRQALKDSGEVNHASLAEARRKIRAIVQSSKRNTSARGRKRIARWEQGGHALGERANGPESPANSDVSTSLATTTTSITDSSPGELQHTHIHLAVPNESTAQLLEEKQDLSANDGWDVDYSLHK